MKERGAGHYKFINEIMFMLFSKDMPGLSMSSLKVVIETEFTMNYITNYIVDVLLKYTKFRDNGTLNLRPYLDNVFIKNVDLWGFCSAYFPFLEILFNNYTELNETEKKLFNLIKELFVTLYVTASEKLNINEINKLLKNVDRLFENKYINNTSSLKQTISSVQFLKKSSKSSKTKKIKKNKLSSSKSQSKISFKRKTLQKKFKNPIFLSLK